MKKVIGVIIVLVITIVCVITILLLSSKKESSKETSDLDLTVQNENIEVTEDEVLISMTVKNEQTKSIAIEDMEIIVLDVNEEEVLRVTSEVNKTLEPNENIIISSQTKANLDSNQFYVLKVNY